jgi:hypothetical protein
VAFNFTTPFTLSTGGLYIYANFTPTGGTEVFSDASRISGLSGLAYEIAPEKAVFGFPDLSTDVQYLASERTTTTSTQRIYTRDATSLTLDKPFTNVLRATYKRTDPFTRNSVVGTLRGYRVGLFTIPVTITTAIASNLTYTGTASVVGGTLGTSVPGAITSTATTFTVFPAVPSTTTTPNLPTITGTIRVFETVGTTTTEKAVLAFAGTVGTNGAISGGITDAPNAFTGAFSGVLAGPNREELAVVFSASHADGRKFVGDLLAD